MATSKPVFTLKFHGTRGSIPVCDKGFQEFGGNTTCISIKGRIDNSLGIIDAGTGIRNLGLELKNSQESIPNEIIIGFTHFHMDHIQGLPFFDLSYNPNVNIHLVAMGEGRGDINLEQIFEGQMKKEYFPVPLHKMGARFKFNKPDKSTDLFYFTRVSAIRHSHPGGAYSYCLEQKGKKIVISTDIEHENGLDQNIIEFARDADLLVHDAQYTKEELQKYKGQVHDDYKKSSNRQT